MPNKQHNVETTQPRSKLRFVASLFPVAFFGMVLFLLYGCLPGGSKIIARTTAPDGTEMCILQKSNYSLEPYTVSFYYRRPGHPWGWFYYDHQDTRWLWGTISVDPGGKLALIKRSGREVAQFDISTESFTINRWKRTLTPAQEWMPSTWKPEDALR